MTDDYRKFLEGKSQLPSGGGFEPLWLPDCLFDFQRHLVEWALRRGRAAVLADCGLGKSLMSLVWAENVARKTGGRVLILTPLAVAGQFVREGEKFGVGCTQSRDGRPGPERVTVANYERLHLFDPADYAGVVCDESSILKCYRGLRRAAITDFLRGVPYRLLSTATAAPNDHVEFGTSSEALGVMDRKHMLVRFFTHDGSDTGNWQLKGHTRSRLFWRWLCSWARAIRRPSDIGFPDAGLELPPLVVNEIRVPSRVGVGGHLFGTPAVSLQEQREDLRESLVERCEAAAEAANAHDEPAVAWCHLNAEADTLERLIRGAVNVQGSDSDERKEEVFRAFEDGEVRVLVSKPTIAGFGLNWQHCSRMTYFPSHSYEQYYQSVRRCWRFGQRRKVVVDCVVTDGQDIVLANLTRKARQADEMFERLVSLMRDEMEAEGHTPYAGKTEAPSWL